MGTWGTGLFSSDMARDIRDFYRERIEERIEDAEATRLTLEKFRSYLDDPEEGPVLLVALAVTQSKIGRLDPVVRGRALAAIDSGADLATWAQENPKLLPKRREVLNKARAQLTGDQPARKRYTTTSSAELRTHRGRHPRSESPESCCTLAGRANQIAPSR